ncbi:Secretin ExeD [Phycisphaerales bacterium]|nr:Secretin ExeD [Phycisphaerales bacterium]
MFVRTRRAVAADLIAVLSMCATASTATLQPQPPPSSPLPPPLPSTGADGVLLAGEIELARLVDVAAARLKLRIEYDAAGLKGTVTLRADAPMDDEALWAFTNIALMGRGFTTVRHASGTVSVVKLSEAPGIAPVVGPDDPLASGFVTLVVRAKHRPVKELAEILKGVLSKQGGSVSPLGGDLLAVSDLAERVDMARDFLSRIDVPSGAPQVHAISVRNTSAASLVALVGQLVTKRETATTKLAGDLLAAPSGTEVLLVCPPETEQAWRDLINRLDAREPTQTTTYSPRFFPAKDVARLLEETIKGSGPQDERFRVVVDDLTSSLIVTGMPEQHRRVGELITRLDAAESGPRPMRSFPIRNRPVSEIVETLSRLIQAGVLESSPDTDDRAAVRAGGEQTTFRALGTDKAGGTPDRSGTPPAGAVTTKAGGDRSTPLHLTADEASNTLIAIGEPRLLAQLESLVTMLDVRQPQVMLEVMLVSMSDTDTLNLGVELERIGSLGDATVRVASLFGLSTAGPAGRVVGDALGFTGVVLNPGEFSVVVRALEAINKGRSLSHPRVLVANNEQARFSSVLEQPFVRTDTTSSTATSSFGGSDSAGTTISVKPQIAHGDHLVLTYSISLSSFVGSASASGLPPPKQQNTVDSVATIPDGHTVVVGGLDLTSDSLSTTQIPFLGRVPILGELFKNRSKGDTRTRFFVFLKATVLRSQGLEDLKYISKDAGARAGVDDGFPEVLPQVIR